CLHHAATVARRQKLRHIQIDRVSTVLVSTWPCPLAPGKKYGETSETASVVRIERGEIRALICGDAAPHFFARNRHDTIPRPFLANMNRATRGTVTPAPPATQLGLSTSLNPG